MMKQIPVSSIKEEEDGYNREIQAMLCRLEEDNGNLTEKKRRLSIYQVNALEKNFKADSKLEPARKCRLAADLGLQPRQVAVWFQNRRARTKAKQLERDFLVLKTSYDALKVDYDNAKRENEALTLMVNDLKAKTDNSGQAPVVNCIQISEDQCFFSAADLCSFFSIDQPPSLLWCFPDHS